MDLLDGRVKLRPLVVTDKPGERAEVQARLQSPGGELAVLADGVNAIRHLGYVELREGKPRGNHYHQLRHESFYLIAGVVEVHLLDIEMGAKATAQMHTGDLLVVPPRIVHTFVPLAAGHAIEFAPEVFDGADVYRHVIFPV